MFVPVLALLMWNKGKYLTFVKIKIFVVYSFSVFDIHTLSAHLPIPYSVTPRQQSGVGKQTKKKKSERKI